MHECDKKKSSYINVDDKDDDVPHVLDATIEDLPAHVLCMMKIFEQLNTKTMQIVLEMDKWTRDNWRWRLFEFQLARRSKDLNSLCPLVMLAEERDKNIKAFMHWLAESYDCLDSSQKFDPNTHVNSYLETYQNITNNFVNKTNELCKEKSVNEIGKISTLDYTAKIMSNFLKILYKWRKGGLESVCREAKLSEKAIKTTLNAGIAETLGDALFFTSCLKSLQEKDITTVVACIGEGHAGRIGKMIEELGGKLLPGSLGYRDAKEGEKVRFITPFELHIFLSQALGLPVAESDIQRVKFMNHLCNYCKKSNASNKCSRCKKSCYCSRECQLSDWSLHKQTCQPQKPEEGHVCNWCRRIEATNKCPKCEKVYYCYTECQKNDSLHKDKHGSNQ